MPPLCAKAVWPTHGARTSCRTLATSFTNSESSLSLGSDDLGVAFKPIFNCSVGMTVMRLQLPVRSPKPLMVPCTCMAPASTAAMALATAETAIVVRVNAHRAVQFGFGQGGGGGDFARQPAAIGVAKHNAIRAGFFRRLPGGQRIFGFVGIAVKTVLGVVNDFFAVILEISGWCRRSCRDFHRAGRATPR